MPTSAVLGIASNVLNNAMNQILNSQNYINTRNLLGIENQYAQQNAEIADQRTRALYNDFESPAAMRKQLENAGLSVGLMYGNGGIGGSMTQGAQPETPSAQNRGTIPFTPILDAQTEMYLANAEKIKADTEKTEAETGEIIERMPTYKQNIKESEKRIEEISQNIKESENRVNLLVEEKLTEIAKQGNINEDTALKKKQAELEQAQKEYYEALKKLSDYDLTRRGEWTDAQIKSWKAAANQANAAAKKLGIESTILEETKQDLILKAFWEHVNEAQKNGQIIKETNKLEEEIISMIEGRYTTEQRNYFFQKNKWLMGMKFMFEGLGDSVGAGVKAAAKSVK